MQAIERFPIRPALGAAFLIALAVGCGSGEIKGVPLKGKVVKNGQLLDAKADLKGDKLVIYFVGTDQGRPIRCPAVYNPADGTFTCQGPVGRGVPEGHYRVEMFGSSFQTPAGVDRAFKEAFAYEKSPLEITVTKENSEKLVVDVGAKTVTAQ